MMPRGEGEFTCTSCIRHGVQGHKGVLGWKGKALVL